MDGNIYMTIRQTAKKTGLPECLIRRKMDEGNVPHIMSGSRPLLNVPLFLERLEQESKENRVVR